MKNDEHIDICLRPAKEDFWVFPEADGFHWCRRGLGYLDARGQAYRTRAEARKAAVETMAQEQDKP